MDILDLIHNISLLIALAAIYQVLISRRLPHTLPGKVGIGILFGLVAIAGMMAPVVLSPGIIFDGRSIILAVAGYVGGPVVAAASILSAGAYRAYLGGGGALVGIAVIGVSAGTGVLFHYLRKHHGERLSPLHLFGFGLLVQLAVLALFTQLPGNAGHRVIKELGTIILLFYPIATMLLALLFQDYEEQERSRKKLHYLAYHDSLSGLPNRTALLEQIGRELDSNQEQPARGALFLINIDRFKRLNDARGHTIGDALLCTVSERLTPLLGKDSLLARLSADEFALLLKRQVSEEKMTQLSEAIHSAFLAPLCVGAEGFIITVSLGYTTLPTGDTDTPGDVMRRADTALHHAKRGGGNQTARFIADMAVSAEQQLQMERELRSAVNTGQLWLSLQSQVDGGGHVIGAEALVRWQHPERGLISPAQFIPLAEESDLIIEVENWVFNETCRLLSSKEVVESGIRLSVNISPRHFHQPGFSDWLRHSLEIHGADPRQLTLEITEGLLIDNLSDAATKMNNLAKLGVRFSVDDFGTGYSSLAYLKSLPIHELKIDKSFVQDAPNDPTLVESILAVADHMLLDVVAEGVETLEQAAIFQGRHRAYIQGFLYGKPQPAAEWLQHLSTEASQVPVFPAPG